MNWANLLKSKAFWGGLGALCVMIGAIVSGEMVWGEALPKVLEVIGAILGGGAVTAGTMTALKK